MSDIQKHCFHYHSPIGCLLLISNGTALTAADIHSNVDIAPPKDTPDDILRQAEKELTEYFEGKRTEFTVPLAPKGTDFQHRVWEALSEIPFGMTWTYGEVAEMIGNKNASRAVGGAVGKNPILIMIPCHRVIAADGKPGGFSVGLDIKKCLHEIEGIITK